MELDGAFVWLTKRRLKPGSRKEFSRSWRPREFPEGMLRAYELVSPDASPTKTHLSLSHDPALANAPTGFTVTVRDIRPYTGAGWLVAHCGDMQTMPGYGRTPAAHAVDIDETGTTVGLF